MCAGGVGRGESAIEGLLGWAVFRFFRKKEGGVISAWAGDGVVLSKLGRSVSGIAASKLAGFCLSRGRLGGRLKRGGMCMSPVELNDSIGVFMDLVAAVIFRTGEPGKCTKQNKRERVIWMSRPRDREGWFVVDRRMGWGVVCVVGASCVEGGVRRRWAFVRHWRWWGCFWVDQWLRRSRRRRAGAR